MAVRKRGSSFESRIMYQGRTYQKSWGAVSKTVAKEKDIQFKASILDGSYSELKAEQEAEKRRVTLAGFAPEYLEYYERQWRPTSYRRTRFLVANLIESLGDRYLDEIQALDVERYKKRRLEAGREKGTVNREINALSNMFELAISFGKATSNPTKQVKRFKEDNEKTWALSEEHESRLLEACASINEREGKEYLHDLVEVALYSGMRQQELFDLKWEHVLLKHGFILVPKSKNYKARKIPLNNTLRAAFKRLRKRSGPCEYSFYQPTWKQAVKPQKRLLGGSK